MPLPLRLTLLVDTEAAAPGLACEHGMCLHVQAGAASLLFDTGASWAAMGNADRLGLDLASVSHVVLSHGHRDHTGGLPEALARCPTAIPVLHPRALGPRFSLKPGLPARPLGFTDAAWAALRPRWSEAWLASAPMHLGRNLGVTGPIPRRHPEEANSGPFHLDPDGQQADPLEAVPPELAGVQI